MFPNKTLSLLVLICILSPFIGNTSIRQGELRRGSAGSGEAPELRLPNPPSRRRPASVRNAGAAQSSSNRPLNPSARTAANTKPPISNPQVVTKPPTSATDERVDEEIELGNLARDLGNSKLDKLQEDPSDELMDQVLEQYNTATRHYQRAAELDPNDFRPYFGLGAIYVDSSERHFGHSHAEAIKNFQTAIARNPTFAEAYVGLSYASSHNRQYEQAIAASQEAIRLRPDYAEAYYTMGSAYFLSNRPEQAVPFYKKAISVKPAYERAYRTLGSVYTTLKKPEERLAITKQWVSIAPRSPDALLTLGSAYYLLFEYEQALATFKQVLMIKPNSVTAHYQLGLCYYRMGNQDASLEQYRILQKLDPVMAQAFYRLINR